MRMSKKSSTFASSIKDKHNSILNILAIRFYSQIKIESKITKKYLYKQIKFKNYVLFRNYSSKFRRKTIHTISTQS